MCLHLGAYNTGMKRPLASGCLRIQVITNLLTNRLPQPIICISIISTQHVSSTFWVSMSMELCQKKHSAKVLCLAKVGQPHRCLQHAAEPYRRSRRRPPASCRHQKMRRLVVSCCHVTKRNSKNMCLCSKGWICKKTSLKPAKSSSFDRSRRSQQPQSVRKDGRLTHSPHRPVSDRTPPAPAGSHRCVELLYIHFCCFWMEL